MVNPAETDGQNKVIKVLFSSKKHTSSVCPKTGKSIKHKSRFCWLRWLFPITGLLALIWFLIRVIPKPSRAVYPCQRVAFPLASGFVVWLLGLAGSTAAYHKAKRSFAQARYVVAAIAIVVSAGFIWLALSSTDEKPAYAHEPIVANSPLGDGKGVYPGRVVWIHDPNATTWGGIGDGYWWDPTHTSQAVVDEMVSKSIRALTGKGSDYAAWDAIFRYFNQQKSKGYVGYQPGEKIMIKVNFVGFIELWGGHSYSYKSNYPNTSPQVIHAVLDHLVNIVEVNESDITVGDTLCKFVDSFYNMLHSDFPNVNYLDYVGGPGRVKAQFSSVPTYWSTTEADGKELDHVPVSYANAEYLINIANLKGHYDHGGVTLCAKNHYGSLLRRPDAVDPNVDYYDLHSEMLDTVPGMGHYRALVDLMGSPHIGGKTILCLIDGLYAGKHPIESTPRRWYTDPFDGDWPSSLFASQDQVAIDSVAFDFLLNEWDETPGPGWSGADDYLHEAALIPDPCSGTNYDPNNDGGLTESLGVHEHWNNATDKQYSRNLDPVNGTGIELVTELSVDGDFDDDGDVDFKDFAVLAAAWRSRKGDANWDADCDISIPSDDVIDEYDLMVFCENWLQ
jgi:hypothetical protein